MPGPRTIPPLLAPQARLSKRFPPKVLSFIVEYVICQNATQAALRAGYSPRSAYSQGGRLLKKAEILAEIDRRIARKTMRIDFKAEDILEELRRIALFDPRAVFDSQGNIRPIADWTAEQASCLASFEVIKKNAEAGDNKTDTIHKVRFVDKAKALELSAKHFALLTEKVEHTGGIEISWRAPEQSGQVQLEAGEPQTDVIEGETVQHQQLEAGAGEDDNITPS